MLVVDHTHCNLMIGGRRPAIFHDGIKLGRPDAIIPRIGASVTSTGAAVIQQFELMRVHTSLPTSALLLARDKLKSLQLLAKHGIRIPLTLAVNSTWEIDRQLSIFKSFPVIVKLIEGTHGSGVTIAESYRSARSLLDTLLKLNGRILVQEYIAEAEGADVRAIVVGDRVVAAMRRQAGTGEFRSNLHLGATSEVTELSDRERDIAIKVTQLMGLSMSGVDMLRSKRGPLVMEVNASPGLEGIETTTSADVAGAMLDQVERDWRKLRNFTRAAKSD